MKAQKESDLVRQCLDYLELRQIMAWRNNTTGVWDPVKRCFRAFHGKKGVSDILGCLPGGTLLAVETKSKTGRLTPEQQQFLDEVNHNGGHAFVVRSLDDLIAALEGLKA